MPLEKDLIQKVLYKVIIGEDYRILILELINKEFIQTIIDFFSKVCLAKANNIEITKDWYKENFILDSGLKKNEIITNAGLNNKTISNIYKSTKKEIAISAAEEHYNELINIIDKLIEENSTLDILLTIKFNKVSVELNINESLLVINAIAVKRAAIRGGAWSSIGKNIEAPLMIALCKLFKVDKSYYKLKEERGSLIDSKSDVLFERDIDFFLVNNNKEYKCEVKLMGNGNPESADAVIARDTKVFIADTLSDTNKKQLNSLKINWVELKSNDGFLKFKSILKALNIPYNDIIPTKEQIEFIIKNI